MDKFDINSFSPNNNYIISADAGTGKTFSIKKIVGKMVSEFNIPIEDILIVTYTDKAAGELKERIRDELKGKVDILKASISTFHSFCMNVIKEFPISANSPLSLTLSTSSVSTREFINEYIRKGDIQKDITSLILLNKLNDETSSSLFNVDTLIDTFVRAIDNYYLNINNEEDESIITFAKDDNFVLFNDIALAYYKRESLSKFYSVPPINKYLKTLKESSLTTLNLLYDELINNNFMFDGNKLRKSKKFNKEEEEAYNFFSNLKNHIKSPHFANYIVYKYLKDIFIQYKNYKIKNKLQTYDDLIFRVREKLYENNSPLLKKLKNKYHYAIIDEFQDTNQKQFDIFKKIFLEDKKHHIIVVGDPKQSIYSFQGADIDAYFNALKVIKNKGGLNRSLMKNYRSTGEVVSSLNHLFHHFEFEKTTFVDTEYLKEGVDDSYHKAFINGQDFKGVFFPRKSDDTLLDEFEFAKFAVSQIIDLCSFDENGHTKLRIKNSQDNEFRNVNFKDFVILARSNKEIKVIRSALTKAGIPYVRYKDNSLFVDKEVQDWKTLFEALVEKDFTGNRRNSFKRVLYTKFFSIKLNDIASEKYNHDDNDEYRLLSKWKYLLDSKQYELLIDDIFSNSKLNEKTSSLSSITQFSKYRQIGEYILSYLLNNHSPEEVISDLTEKIINNPDDGIIAKSTDFNCVSILTIHASKGLQYPVVISIAGFVSNKSQSAPYIYYQDDKRILSFSSKGDLVKKTTYEDERLYYVNFTRAQYLLIIPNHKNFGIQFIKQAINDFIKEDTSYYSYIDYKDEDYQTLKNKVKDILLFNSGSFSFDTKEKEKQDEINKNLINIKYSKGMKKYSYSSLSHPHNENEVNDEDDIYEDDENKECDLRNYDKEVIVYNLPYDSDIPSKPIPVKFPKGAKIGNAIHKIFECIDFTNYDSYVFDVISSSFRSEGITIDLNVDESAKEYMKSIVDNVNEMKLPIIEGNKISSTKYLKLKDITLENRKNEIEFNYNINKSKLFSYCNGFIDLLFVYNNRFILLDYKSDTLNEDFPSYNSLSSLKEHVDERYSIQRVLYSYTLIMWLKGIYTSESEEEIFDKYFGGIHYLFVRGALKDSYNGAISFTWDSFAKLKESYLEIINDKVK
ncbi:MAG: UvrD-helicase domain-containing protein [Bacilli bacterium]